jgi:enoyl-CoA hydratase/carnithine racemase
MRWLLTGDEFDATEALRIGLVQEVVEHGKQIDKAIEIATRIARKRLWACERQSNRRENYSAKVSTRRRRI